MKSKFVYEIHLVFLIKIRRLLAAVYAVCLLCRLIRLNSGDFVEKTSRSGYLIWGDFGEKHSYRVIASYKDFAGNPAWVLSAFTNSLLAGFRSAASR